MQRINHEEHEGVNLRERRALCGGSAASKDPGTSRPPADLIHPGQDFGLYRGPADQGNEA